jgi:hypothetical protein
MFVGSTEGKGKFILPFILSEVAQATDSGYPVRSRSKEHGIAGCVSAGFVEML